jgi:hypothetical protein
MDLPSTHSGGQEDPCNLLEPANDIEAPNSELLDSSPLSPVDGGSVSLGDTGQSVTPDAEWRDHRPSIIWHGDTLCIGLSFILDIDGSFRDGKATGPPTGLLVSAGSSCWYVSTYLPDKHPRLRLDSPCCEVRAGLPG